MGCGPVTASVFMRCQGGCECYIPRAEPSGMCFDCRTDAGYSDPRRLEPSHSEPASDFETAGDQVEALKILLRGILLTAQFEISEAKCPEPHRSAFEAIVVAAKHGLGLQ